MNKRTSYPGIDYFRLVAAFLVVAIHTSPLSGFSETGDFILTRIIARVAVPFFLMTTGFFLMNQNSCSTEKLKSFLKKTAVLYGIATLIYVPVNIYSGYFRADNLIPNILKDIVFDGTFYHLWYLPSSMLGAVIAWYLVKKLNYKKALAAASVLYLIGLFGDSYYGITEKIPGLDAFYHLLFHVMDYTRNGIFFVPVFFILGGFIAKHRAGISRKSAQRTVLTHACQQKTAAIGFCVCFGLMFAEALLLHHFDLQRHDSMYLFLPPCMYFLFQALLSFKGKRHALLGTASLIIYLIHPMMIVVVRLFAKLLHLQDLLIENNLIHYLAVCVMSAGFAVMICFLRTLLHKRSHPKLHSQ